ncbi:uncharacterized protein FIBRA_00684 [Fibroporia radiculosa]|uniref:Uncharacterized protein n=1 Tax=Fibroporia radiculosa TaxID=599839 RepID=J4HS08_9APHY|nr:uncharacterized protein FIBRA_00684 [Fibroporia radiculosa]CCL98682.1 predicted protein [Fibroporia radiculosa]
MRAARKYDMEAVQRHLADELVKFAEQEPLRVFAVAFDLELYEICRKAAKLSLRKAICQSERVPLELGSLPSPVFYQLMRYRTRCTEAAQEVLTNLRWVLTQILGRKGNKIVTRLRHDYVQVSYEWPALWIWFRCTSCLPHCDKLVPFSGAAEHTPRMWWKEYVDRVWYALEGRPVGSVSGEMNIFEPSIRRAVTCTVCAPDAYKDLKEFSEQLASRIDKAVSMVGQPVNVYSSK